MEDIKDVQQLTVPEVTMIMQQQIRDVDKVDAAQFMELEDATIVENTEDLQQQEVPRVTMLMQHQIRGRHHKANTRTYEHFCS